MNDKMMNEIEKIVREEISKELSRSSLMPVANKVVQSMWELSGKDLERFRMLVDYLPEYSEKWLQSTGNNGIPNFKK